MAGDDDPVPDVGAPTSRTRRDRPLLDPGPLCLLVFLAAATLAMSLTGRTIALAVFALLLGATAVAVAVVAVRRRR